MRLALALLSAFMLAPTSPVLAAPKAGDTFDNWAVECEQGSAGVSHCFLSQTHLMAGNNARLLKASIGYLGPKQEPMLVFLLPLGVDLRAGVAMKIDDQPQISLAYQQCVQDGCIGTLALDQATVAALRKAKRIQVGFRPFGSNETMTVELSPAGLGRGMDALR